MKDAVLAAKPRARQRMMLGSGIVLLLAMVGIAAFYTAANRTMDVFFADFKQQRQEAVRAALDRAAESVAISVKDQCI